MQSSSNGTIHQRRSFNNKSRNNASIALSKTSIKESLSSYLLTERRNNLHSNNFVFNSYEKNYNYTIESCASDLRKANMSKFKIMNLKTINAVKAKRRGRIGLGLAFSPRENVNEEETYMRHIERHKVPIDNSNSNGNNLLLLSNDYKPHGMINTSQTSSNVMNIVNNLHTDSVSQGGRNKNVEINFNKYEIKILSNKPTSANSIKIKKKIQQQQPSVQQDNLDHKKSNVEILYSKDRCIQENVNNKQRDNIVENDNDNNHGVDNDNNQIKTERLLFKTSTNAKTSLVIKSSFLDNESSDVTSTNLICVKQQQPTFKVLNDNKVLITKTELDQVKGLDQNQSIESKQQKSSLVHQDNKKERTDHSLNANDNNLLNNNKNNAIDTTSTSNNNMYNKNDLPAIFLRDIQIISNQCEIEVIGNENITSNDFSASLDNNPLIKIINERNSQDDNDNELNNFSNDLSTLILGKKHSIATLRLRNIAHEKEKERERENNKRSIGNYDRSIKREDKDEKDNCVNLSIIKPKNNDSSTQKEIENILDSSSNGSISRSKTKKSIKEFLNIASQSNKIIEANKIELASIEPFNLMSTTFNSSSLNGKQQKESSFCSFFNKRATSVVLLPKKKVMKKNVSIQFKLQPKKNKRFLKQLSKISENANHLLSLTHQKTKAAKSSSLPMPISKLIRSHMQNISLNLDINPNPTAHTNLNVSQSLTHQLSFTLPKSDPKMFSNHQDSVLLMKKKSVINEVDQSSQSSIKISSSSYSSIKDKSDQDLDYNKCKKGSMITKSTNSINFVDLRTNSVRINNDISKCATLNEKSFCQPFILKQLNAIEMDQMDIESNVIEAKNDLLSKIMLVIDIKCDRIEERRRKTLTQYATETLLQVESQKRIQWRDFMFTNDNDNEGDPAIEQSNEAKTYKEYDIINEYEFINCIYSSFVFSNNQFLLKPLSEKYFQFSLLYHLRKEKYLDQEIIIQEGTIINNFSKKRKILKRQRTSLNSVTSKRAKLKHNMSSNKSKIKTVYDLNAAFCFQFIMNDDINCDNEEKEDAIIEKKIMQLRNARLTSVKKSLKKRESRINVLSNAKKKTQLFKKSTSRLSFLSRKSLDSSTTMLQQLQRKDSILHKPFYLRHFESKENKETEE